MPTVIDSLVVTLGLDASKFTAQQKQAVASLKQFEDAANKHGKGAQKGIDDLVGSFKDLQGRLLAIGALIAAGLGFNRFVQDVTKANTELGQLSKTLQISGENLSAWDHVGRTVGAATNEMSQGIKKLDFELSKFRAGMGSDLMAWMGTVGVPGVANMRTGEDVFRGLNAYYNQQAAKGPQQAKDAAFQIQNFAGLSQGQLNAVMLPPQEFEKRYAFGKKFAPSQSDIDKFTKLNQAFGDLLTVIDKITRDALVPFITALTQVLKKITDWLVWWAGSPANAPDAAGVALGQMGYPELAPNSRNPSLLSRGWNKVKGWLGYSGGVGGAANDNAPMSAPVGTLAEQRAKFATELENNPALREKILRIAANEQGSNPRGTTAILESMMNRAIVRGTNLETQARWYGLERGGYYDPGNMGRGSLENPASRAVLEQSLKNALSGTNASNYATDNASGDLARRHRISGRFRATGDPIHGESFFAPGTAEVGLARKWDQWRGAMQISPPPAVAPPGSTGAQKTFELWKNMGGAKGAASIFGDTNSNTNNSNTTTNIHSMNVTVPHGADPSAYADGISRRLADYDNIQNANTGMV